MNQSRFLWVAYVGLGAVMTVLILLNPGRFMSVDSHYYLRSATNLLAGRGYVILEQGQWIWNGTFPIGYPALIAILSGLTGLPILVASKVVNYAAIGMSGYGWVRRLGAARAIWPLSIWGLGGFLKIAVYTWSETIFLVLLAEWVWGLYQFLQNPNATRTFSLFLLGYGLFLIRYVGGFVFGLTSLLALTSWLVPIWFQAKAEPSLSPTISRKFLVIAVAGFAGMGMYFWMNQRLSGSLFGGERFVSTESAWELVQLFGWAMLNECLLIRDFSSGGSNLLAWMGVGIQFLLFTVFYWQFGRQQWSAEKMPASNLLMWPFVLTAVVYVLVLFSLRTVSPFSDPNLRLMAPFTYCFLTAGLLWVSEWPACWQKNLRPYWLLLLLCSWLQLLPQHDLLQRISLLLE